MHKQVNPDSLEKPIGYAHGVLARGSFLFIAGQVSHDKEGKMVSVGDIVGQFRQAMTNFKAVLTEGGGKPENLVKINIFTTNKNAYAKNGKEIGKIYRELFGKNFPAMTLCEVKSLFEDDYLLEIEGTAVIPD